MTEEQDLQLLQRLQAGDRAAETELFQVYGPQIVHKVRYTSGITREDSQDLISEIQMTVLISLREGKFDTNKGISLGSYIYGITRNKIRDYFKMQKKEEVFIAADPLPESATSIEEAFELEQHEIRQMVRNLLSQLKLKYKEVLYLRYFEELSVIQISERIHLPPRRVSERLNYAIKLLQKKCSQEKIFSILRAILIIYLWRPEISIST